MNLLSLISAMLATAFLIGGIYCLTRSRKRVLNTFSFLVLVLLGWWSFCNAFFFSAETTEELWFWHHMAAFGWTGFIAETTYYFIVLTGFSEKMKKLWMQLAFYALPVVLLAYNLFGETTSLATGFVRSSFGSQWTYVNSPDNIWLWLYLFCLTLYFGFSFILLLRWAAKVKHNLKKQMAIGFVILDALTILFGFITDVVVPMTDPVIPAVANIGTVLFGAGYFFIIIHFDLFNLNLVVEDRDIINHSTDAVLVVDEEGEILFFNPAASEILEAEKSKLMGRKFSEIFGEEQCREKITNPLAESDFLSDAELSIEIPDGKNKKMLLSAAIIRDKNKEYLGTVFSMRDITLLSKLKEQYRIQSDKFEKLAFVDTLTGLPNRRKAFEVLGEYAEEYRETKKDFFLLYMDLDNFKSVNDLYGHDVGDRFLIEIARRLNECVTGELTFFGRLSGDELLMIGSGDASDETVSACIERVRNVFSSELKVDDLSIKSGISIGSARYSDFLDIDAMVHHADEQMYGAKQASHNSKTRANPREK